MTERLPVTIRLTAEQKRTIAAIQRHHGLTGMQDVVAFLIAKEGREVQRDVKVGKA